MVDPAVAARAAAQAAGVVGDDSAVARLLRKVGGVMARRRRGIGLFDVVMVLILVAAVWFVLGQAGIVPPLPIGR